MVLGLLCLLQKRVPTSAARGGMEALHPKAQSWLLLLGGHRLGQFGELLPLLACTEQLVGHAMIPLLVFWFCRWDLLTAAANDGSLNLMLALGQ